MSFNLIVRFMTSRAQYMENRKQYLKLKALSSRYSMCGGGQSKMKSKQSKKSIKPKEKSPQSIDKCGLPERERQLINTAYQLTLGAFTTHEPMNLKSADSIETIGRFNVECRVVIGDTDYAELNLRNGSYTAYRVNGCHLMIINDDLNITPDKSIVDWKWTHSGEGVGVDTGRFGFYDQTAVSKINEEMGEPHSNNLPSVSGCADEMIVRGKSIDNIPKKLADELDAFGVIAGTVTGDGGFECYVIGDDRAILIGGEWD